jgi:predicted permease
MLFDSLRQDVGYALRVLRRSPGFTSVAILSLALGMGANTAVFSLIDALLLRLLPVREPGQLVELLQHYPGEPRGGYWSGASFEYYRDHNHVFSGLTAASAPARVSVRGPGVGAQMATAQSVAENFFDVLGVQPLIGRGGQSLALVSCSFWKTTLHADPAIVGKQIIVQDKPVTVSGVTPPEFFGLQMGSRTDLWLPLPLRAPAGLELLGRLKPGVSREQARAEMTVLYRFTIEERERTSKDALIRHLRREIEPAGSGLSFPRDQFARPLLVLMAVVGLILLIACTNLAGLLLARGAARQKEMSVRVALGAGRLRLMRQVFTESLVLSGLGSLVGVVFAYFGAGALVRMITSGRPILGLPEPFELPLRPDTHLLLFTGGIALLTGLLFGLAPAWNAFSLRGVSRSRVFGKVLVVAQVGFSVLLLSAAGLFISRLSDLRHSDLGFRRDHVLLVTLNSSGSGYGPEALSGGYQDLLRRMEALPGVRSATLCGATPLSGAGASGFANGVPRYVSISSVGPKYFDTLGIARLAGRDFNLQDQRVAIINRAMARSYFPDTDPVGKQVKLEHVTGEREDKTYRIIGVVGDAHLRP